MFPFAWFSRQIAKLQNHFHVISPKPHISEEDDEEDDEKGDEKNEVQYIPSWTTLPDSLTVHIFSFLGVKSLYNASFVCKSWYRVAFDELLWKELFYRRWKISRTVPIAPGRQSWVKEYKRLLYHTPVVESQVLTGCLLEVLHVSFSHNGKMFATTSKGADIRVWTTDFPTRQLYFKILGLGHGDYPRFSQFNSNDSRLLVSCQKDNSTPILLIFELKEKLPILHVINNYPFKTFGSWFDENNIITLEQQQEWEFRNNIYLRQVVHDNTSCTDGPDDMNKVLVSPLNDFTFGMVTVAEITSPDDNTDFSQNSPEVLDGKLETTSSDHSSSLDTQGSRQCDFIVDISRLFESERPSDAKWVIFATGSTAERGPNRLLIRTIKSPKHLIDGQQPASSKNCERLIENSHFAEHDTLLDLEGRIFGICCSPDQRYLYVSMQSWREPGKSRTGPNKSAEMVIKVIDLQKRQLMDIVHHTGFSLILYWLNIYLDVSDDYVASGSENKKGYLWDRHYGIRLQNYPHFSTVNAVAFNPTDPEMLVTVSDDGKVKVWRSLNRQKKIMQK